MSNAGPDVKSIFGRALEIASPSGRTAYLQEACGNDDALRAEVEGLLQALDRAGPFLNRPVLSAGSVDQPVLLERSGTCLGPYKLLEQIGEGGFGVVFMAGHHPPLPPNVALKALKPGIA